jgi:hypothetical protein
MGMRMAPSHNAMVREHLAYAIEMLGLRLVRSYPTPDPDEDDE